MESSTTIILNNFFSPRLEDSTFHEAAAAWTRVEKREAWNHVLIIALFPDTANPKIGLPFVFLVVLRSSFMFLPSMSLDMMLCVIASTQYNLLVRKEQKENINFNETKIENIKMEVNKQY